MGRMFFVEVHRGGVTGKPVAVLGGYGNTTFEALKDALTVPDASKVLRPGDFLILKPEHLYKR